MKRPLSHCVLLLLLLLEATGSDGLTNDRAESLAFARNRQIGRGMNLGNALEAPTEGAWGLIIQESHIQAVADAGFDSVRLPIRWSAHVQAAAPGRISREFLERVDEVVGWCQERRLAVILTVHHFDELCEHPEDESNRNTLISIWRQLAQHYRSYDHEKLFFEVLNEPHGSLTPGQWNQLFPSVITTIRVEDKERTLIIDAPDYAHHASLEKLALPKGETNVIVSVRYYLPYEFTHQGAHWVEGSEQWLGTTWSGNRKEVAAVIAHLRFVKGWSEKHHQPITIGEFGSIALADEQSRLAWTKSVRTKFEAGGFSWSYFDFGVLFKAYDIEKQDWLPGFKEALVGD